MGTFTKNWSIRSSIVLLFLWGPSLNTSPLIETLPEPETDISDDLDLLARSLQLLAPEEQKTVKTRDTREIYLEEKIHELINQERAQAGLKKLEWHEKLAQAARNHSMDMTAAGKCEHVVVPGHDFLWRYKQVGFTEFVQVGLWRHLGAENISYFGTTGKIGPHGTTLDEIAQTTVTGWMASKGHHDNIVTPYWGREGIGVSVTFDRATSWTHVYVTENFC